MRPDQRVSQLVSYIEIEMQTFYKIELLSLNPYHEDLQFLNRTKAPRRTEYDIQSS